MLSSSHGNINGSTSAGSLCGGAWRIVVVMVVVVEKVMVLWVDYERSSVVFLAGASGTEKRHRSMATYVRIVWCWHP